MKQKRTYSRKHTALRWIIRLAAVLLALHMTGWYCLLPGRAVERAVRREGLFDTETVHVEWGEHLPMKGRQLRVVADEYAAVLYSVEMHPVMGWYTVGIAGTLDLYDPERYVYTWDVHKRDSNLEWICLFGYVPDGEQSPTFRVGACDWYKHLTQGYGYLEGQYQDVTPVPTISVAGGKLYLEQFGVSRPEDEDIVAVATILRDGEWVEPKQRCSTSMGWSLW